MKGIEGCIDDVPVEVPKELSWSVADATISTAVVLLASEAELMAKAHVPEVLVAYMKSWIKGWDGGKAPRGPRESWLAPAVRPARITHT